MLEKQDTVKGEAGPGDTATPGSTALDFIMSTNGDFLERLRAADPDHPKSPVIPPEHFRQEFSEQLETWEFMVGRDSPSLRVFSDITALQLRAKDREQRRWQALRAEFYAIAGGQPRLIELFEMAEHRWPDGRKL